MEDLEYCQCGHSKYDHCLDDDHCCWDYEAGETGGACNQCQCSVCLPTEQKFLYLKAEDYIDFVDNKIILHDWDFDATDFSLDECYSEDEFLSLRNDIEYELKLYNENDEIDVKHYYLKVTEQIKNDLIAKSKSNAYKLCGLDKRYDDCFSKLNVHYIDLFKSLDLKNNKYISIKEFGRPKAFKTKEDVLVYLKHNISYDIYTIVPFKKLEVVIDLKE
jgi:hypothetical protein